MLGQLNPMLSTLVAAPFDDPARIFEPKYAGLRDLARFDGRALTLLSRAASQHVSSPTWRPYCGTA
jgi:ATP-dependent DNA ligase